MNHSEGPKLKSHLSEKATSPSIARGYACCLFAVLLWSVTFVTTKQLLEHFGAVQILFTRFVFGYLTLWLLAPHKTPWLGRKTEMRIALCGFLSVTCYFLLENLALVFGPAGMVAVLICTAPVMTAFFGRLIGRIQQLPLLYWTGALATLPGIALIVGSGSDIGDNTLFSKSILLSATLALSGAATWAWYTLLYPKTSAVGRLQVTRRIFFWGLLSMLPLCAFTFDRWSFAPMLEPALLGRLAFLGIVASALCYAAWNTAVAVLGEVRSTVCLYMNPPLGVLAGVIVLSEPLTTPVIAGVLLTLIGVIVSTQAANRPAPKNTTPA